MGLQALTSSTSTRLRIVVRHAAGAGVLAIAYVVDLLIWQGDGTVRGGGRAPAVLVAAVDFAVFALMLLRSRFPLSMFAVAWTYTVLAGAMLPMYEPCLALFFPLHHLARTRSLRTAVLALAICVVPVAVNITNNAVNLDLGAETVAGLGLLWSVLFGLVWTAGRMGLRAERMAHRQRRAMAERLAAEAALARQNERLRLVRELHDSVAAAVTGIVFQAAGSRQAPPDVSTLVSTLGVVERSGLQALRELRRVLRLLSETGDNMPDDLDTGSSLDDLPALFDATRRLVREVHIQERGTRDRLSPHADHAAFRVVQEALTNATKHGGRGSVVRVLLNWQPGELHLSIADHHASARREPLDVGPSGFGLAGLTDRVDAVGGRLSYGETATNTFTVDAVVPTAALTPGPAGASPRAPEPPGAGETSVV